MCTIKCDFGRFVNDYECRKPNAKYLTNTLVSNPSYRHKKAINPKQKLKLWKQKMNAGWEMFSSQQRLGVIIRYASFNIVCVFTFPLY